MFQESWVSQASLNRCQGRVMDCCCHTWDCLFQDNLDVVQEMLDLARFQIGMDILDLKKDWGTVLLGILALIQEIQDSVLDTLDFVLKIRPCLGIQILVEEIQVQMDIQNWKTAALFQDSLELLVAEPGDALDNHLHLSLDILSIDPVTFLDNPKVAEEKKVCPFHVLELDSLLC